MKLRKAEGRNMLWRLAAGDWQMVGMSLLLERPQVDLDVFFKRGFTVLLYRVDMPSFQPTLGFIGRN